VLKFSVTELSGLAETELVLTGGASAPGFLAPVVTDTRKVEAQDFYLALKGERFDGHRFVMEAAKRGASLAIVEKSQIEAVRQEIGSTALALLVVPDTLQFYQAIALHARRRHKPFVIGITGSSGKTTTKEMVGCVFSASGKGVHKSLANQNNEIGVPLTILSMPEETSYLILEMGMRGLGQIDELARVGEPDLGIITGVGTTHIELLGSKENIARAKCELYANLEKRGGIAICGELSDLVRNACTEVFSGRVYDFDSDKVEITAVTSSGTEFSLKINDHSERFFVKAHGSYLVRDAWCAVKAGILAGLSVAQIKEGLACWSTVEGRGNVIEAANGLTIVDESYNANPDSVRCAVDAILTSSNFQNKRKFVVLAKMAELGDYTDPLHLELGQWLRDKAVDFLFTVGAEASLIAKGASGAMFKIFACADKAEAFDRLRSLLAPGDCVMIKGSHSTNLDELVLKLNETGSFSAEKTVVGDGS